MAIESKLEGSIFSNEYKRIPLSYTGPLKDFTHTVTGLRPNTKYYVGCSFDATDNTFASVVANGFVVVYTYTAGSRSYREISGVGTATVGNGGVLAFAGGASATTGVNGALVLFYVPIAS